MRAHFCPWRSLLTAAWLVTLCAVAHAQVAPSPVRSVRSFSGQFVIRGNGGSALVGRQPAFAQDGKHLTLQPALLAVSCERIKQSLDSELNDRSQWRSKIFVSLFNAQSADDEIGFLAEHFKDGWSYRLEIPTPVERTRLVRALMQALLTERANRQAGERSAELPLWLVEGLTQQLIANHGVEVLLAPPEAAVNLVPISRSVTTNDISKIWRKSTVGGPLSLEALSWPKSDQLSGPEAASYGESARLFVNELLRFQDGRASLVKFLNELPNYHNWQMAFLRGFGAHFGKLLDVEKWWALQVDYFNGRDAYGLWSQEVSGTKLDALMSVPVELRHDKKDLPTVANLPLTTVISEWDFARQQPALKTIVSELDGMRSRVSPDLVLLVDGYRQVLADYLATRKKRFSSSKAAIRQALASLAELDLQRQNLKVRTLAPVASAASTASQQRVK